MIAPRHYDKPGQMADEMVALLTDHFTRPSEVPYAVMLSGGQTPLPIYRRIAQRPPTISKTLHLLFTDERMVPDNSPESNYANTRAMIEALRISPDRVLRVHTKSTTEQAAQRYNDEIDAFIERGGRIGLGLLGLGADGHTASLFSRDDVRRGSGRWAIPVLRAKPPERVSVTPDLLATVESLVFFLAGPEKQEIAQAFLDDPEKYPAGLAVADARNVELWLGAETLVGKC